jgi:hypothetical protein
VIQDGSAIQGYDGKKFSSTFNKGQKPVYHFELLVKDFSTLLSGSYTRILVSSHDGKLKNDLFSGINLDKAKSAADAAKQVNAKLETLTSFNVWVDGLVEKVGKGDRLRLVDT